VLHGDPAPLPNRGQSPQFSAHFYCGQTAGCIKMVLGMEVGLRPGDVVLDGVAAPPKRGTTPIFRFMSIVAKRLVYEDASWYGSRYRPKLHCIRQGLSSPAKGAQQPPLFSVHVYCGHGRPSQLLLSPCFNLYLVYLVLNFNCLLAFCHVLINGYMISYMTWNHV